MTFKEFELWCGKRASDGCLNMEIANLCIRVIDIIRRQPFWKREKFWESNFEKLVKTAIINPVDTIKAEKVGE